MTYGGCAHTGVCNNYPFFNSSYIFKGSQQIDMTLLFFSSVDRYVNLAGQAPIALASDGHNLIFIGTDFDILSKKIGGAFLFEVTCAF